MIVHRNDATARRSIPQNVQFDGIVDSHRNEYYDNESLYDEIQDDDGGYEKLNAAERCVLLHNHQQQWRIQGRFVGFGRTPSGRVWWLKTLQLHDCIKVVQ